MRGTSNNAILYRGRYIRRCIIAGKPVGYVLSWAAYGSERALWRGSLAELLEHLDSTVRFFGKWDKLI